MSTALTHAILYGELDDVKQHITPYTDLDDYDDYGYTPLIEAVIAGKEDIVEYLLSENANPNQRDTTGYMPLHWAVNNNSSAIAQILLKHNADPNGYTTHSMPAGTLAWLRHQSSVMMLLEAYDADVNFIQDYIYSKLIAHRFQLNAKIDLYAPQKKFIELDLEGFILEATFSIVFESIKKFVSHAAGKNYKHLKRKFKRLDKAIKNTETLLRLQHYMVDPFNHKKTIDNCIQSDIVILPIVYTGHAICFAKVGNLLAKCDRGIYGKHNGTLNLYQITQPQNFNFSFIQKFFYTATTENFAHEGINQVLGLKPLITLPIPPQITGNCSWANMEGIVPGLIFMLLSQDSRYDLETCEETALSFFDYWRQWDKTQALDDMLTLFSKASKPRQASIASLFTCILFQYCRHHHNDDCEIARKIGVVFKSGRFDYILEAYIQYHHERYKNKSGKNFAELLDIAGIRD